MLQEFPVLIETQICVLKAVIGALYQDQVTKHLAVHAVQGIARHLQM